MDPMLVLMAAIGAANQGLMLANKVWDATPAALQQQGAVDYAKFLHNMGAFIIGVQDKINSLVAQPQPAQPQPHN